jgi:hypothetical protein
MMTERSRRGGGEWANAGQGGGAGGVEGANVAAVTFAAAVASAGFATGIEQAAEFGEAF